MNGGRREEGNLFRSILRWALEGSKQLAVPSRAFAFAFYAASLSDGERNA